MSAWTADQLAQLLHEANAHPWESVQAALDGIEGQPHPRVAWLTTHLSVTKREYAALIAAAAGAPTPPDDAGLRNAWPCIPARPCSGDRARPRGAAPCWPASAIRSAGPTRA